MQDTRLHSGFSTDVGRDFIFWAVQQMSEESTITLNTVKNALFMCRAVSFVIFYEKTRQLGNLADKRKCSFSRQKK